jgi:hypothetical protein
MVEPHDITPIDDERAQSADDLVDKLDWVGRTTVKVAASTVLATTLVGALSEPPNTDLMTLPEPTPIVQMYQAVDDDPIPDEDDEDDESAQRWQRVLKILKMLFVALALAGTIAFGALKGCAGIVGTLALPGDDEQQEQSATPSQTEDERGVAVAG